MASLLGGSLHLERCHGRTNDCGRSPASATAPTTFVLQGLDTKAEYRSALYTDLQTYWTYDLTDNVELGFLGLYSTQPLRPWFRRIARPNSATSIRPCASRCFFEGQESTQFETYFGALNLNVPASTETCSCTSPPRAFQTFESERFDVLGSTSWMNWTATWAASQFGEVLREPGGRRVPGPCAERPRGHRDHLRAQRLSAAPRGRNYLQWGADVRSEVINDKLSEWTMIDSTDYSIPLNTGDGPWNCSYTLKSTLEHREHPRCRLPAEPLVVGTTATTAGGA